MARSIRSRSYRSSRRLDLASLALEALAVACAIALTPTGHAFGFATVPLPLLLTVTRIVIADLSAAEAINNVARWLLG